MRIANSITRSYQDTGETISNKEQPTGNKQDIFDMDIPVGVDQVYPLKIVRAEMQSLGIMSDGALTIGTNGTVFGSPPTKTDRIDTIANKEYVWTLDQDTLTAGVMKVTPPTADITSIYVTNASSPPVTIRLRIKCLKIQ